MNPTTPPPSPMKKLRPGLKKLTTGSPTRLSPTKLSPMRLSPTRPTHKKLNPKSSVMVDPNFGPSLKRKLKEEPKEMVGMTTKPNASDRNYDPTALFQRNTGAKRPISRYTSTIARWLNTNLVHGRQATTPVRNGWLHRLRLCKRKADCTSNRLKGCGWSLGT